MTVVEQLETDAKAYDDDRALVDSDEFVARMFQEWPRNDDLWTVQQKVVALDNLYGTRFGDRKIWFEVARHIASLAPSLDEHFRNGSPRAVEMIRTIRRDRGTQGNEYVFATKFAHWHNPEAYPIYDSRVGRALPLLAQITPECDALAPVAGRSWDTHLADYGVLKAVHDACRKAWVPDWSCKRFDKALYIRGKDKKPKPYE